MSSTKKRQFIFLQILAVFIIAAVSCNSKETTEETDIAVTPAIVAITKFSLGANDKVMKNLDSVFFAIDLNTGVIFNADSLPKGTDVSRLIPSITFANTMSKAVFSFVKDNELDTANYLTNPEDSIDFREPVKLDVVAQDGVNSYTYTIKVNVHLQDPDTLIWDRLATSTLPSTYTSPVAQKTLLKDLTAYCLIEEYNGEYTLSTCEELNKGEWEKDNVSFEFNPVIASFTNTTDQFWILSEEGHLYGSPDGLNWQDTEQTWVNIIGGYGETLLGIREEDSSLMHTLYPMPEGYNETHVEDNFPIQGTSMLGVMKTEWADTDFAILTGGVTAENKLSSAVWAFDGDTWAIINDTDLPALINPMLARYVVYRDTPYVFLKREMDVWLIIGGTNRNGSMNRDIYLTYNNGVNWVKASNEMQLPTTIPSLEDADLIVAGYDLTADLSEAWTIQPSTRSGYGYGNYSVDGFDITWICPYMYIFGGYSTRNILSTVIWRGVIARLTFTPII